MVQRDTVLLSAIPAQRSNGVEAFTRCRQRRGQDCILLGRDLKSDAQSALHTSYMRTELDSKQGLPAFPLPTPVGSLHAEVPMKAEKSQQDF
jgi:hypothetical protein